MVVKRWLLALVLLLPVVYANIVVPGVGETFRMSVERITSTPAVILLLLSIGLGVFPRRSVLFAQVVTWGVVGFVMPSEVLFEGAREISLLMLYFCFFTIVSFVSSFVMHKIDSCIRLQQKWLRRGFWINAVVTTMLFLSVVLFYVWLASTPYGVFQTGEAWLYVADVMMLVVFFLVVTQLAPGRMQKPDKGYRVRQGKIDGILLGGLFVLFIVVYVLAPGQYFSGLLYESVLFSWRGSEYTFVIAQPSSATLSHDEREAYRRSVMADLDGVWQQLVTSVGEAYAVEHYHLVSVHVSPGENTTALFRYALNGINATFLAKSGRSVNHHAIQNTLAVHDARERLKNCTVFDGFPGGENASKRFIDDFLRIESIKLLSDGRLIATVDMQALSIYGRGTSPGTYRAPRQEPYINLETSDVFYVDESTRDEARYSTGNHCQS